MQRLDEGRLHWLSRDEHAALLRGGLKGVEREALRVDTEGQLSRVAHPKALGSALTHQYITTDYSEALLEFVTPAYTSTWEVQQFLCDLHQFTYENIGDEMLWSASMPCVMTAEADIPIAEYGNSNVGRMKNIYRRGLGYRYGRTMQTISGVHFNYSLPVPFWKTLKQQDGSGASLQEFMSERYMGLVRNFRRVGWLVLYLFGNSPAICKSFLPYGGLGLQEFDSSTWYAPYATSLRMSGLGYQNTVQAGLYVSANTLEEYVRGLSRAITTPSEKFERIGVAVDGDYRQLNANVLQIENEYYSAIRPKRRAESGERPTLALSRRGVEYVEVRALDVNLEAPTGIDQAQMRFLEAFLILCALADSPPIGADERREIDLRQSLVAEQGRRPGLALPRDGVPVTLTDWATELVQQTQAIAEILDGQGEDYRYATAAAAAVARDPEQTPSATLLDELRSQKLGFFAFGLQVSVAQRDYYAELMPLSPGKQSLFSDEASNSLRRQTELENQPAPSFEEYLAAYYQG